MFVLVKDPVAFWPVVWNGVAEDGSLFEQSMKLKLVRIDRAEYLSYFSPEVELTAEEEWACVTRLVKGWADIVDAKKKPVPFNHGNLRLLLESPGFSLAFTLAYIRYWQAIPQEREKNSAPSPAGPAGAAAESIEEPAADSGNS